MTQPLLFSIKNLSKKYRLYDSPWGRVKEALLPWQTMEHDDLWVLRDINFNMKRGEVVGILGRNGSGKSTLLQLIAGVLETTSGEIDVTCSVSALLELGAGFNPELTGRENVRIHGILHGCTREEIERRMSQVENFAEIGGFFDRPVKLYSSGMFMRVAFASAISVEPDLLVIDEALAVGDVKFQNRCFEKLTELRQNGTSILLVTHSTEVIANRCSRGLVLEGGQIVYDGDPSKACDKYYEVMFPSRGIQENGALPKGEVDRSIPLDFLEGADDNCRSRANYNEHETILGPGGANIVDFALATFEDEHVCVVSQNCDVRFDFKVHFEVDVPSPLIGLSIKTVDGVVIYATNSFLSGMRLPSAAAGGLYAYSMALTQRLASGTYFVDVGVAVDDGTRGGNVMQVRRSLFYFVVDEKGGDSFDGVADFGPTQFTVIDLADGNLLSRSQPS